MAKWPISGNVYPVTPKAYPVLPKSYPGTGVASYPSGFASFFDLGAWDFSQVSGVDDDTLSVGIASLAGSGVQTMTPVSAPRLDDAAIGGRRALSFDGVGVFNYLRCDALAARFTIGNALTVVVRYRSTRSFNQPLFAAGKSSSAVDTFFNVFHSSLGKLRIDTNTTTAGTVQRAGTADLQYDEHVITVTVSAAGVIKAYIDGVQDTLASSAMDPNALTCDRFAVAAILSTGVASSFTGYVQWFGMSTTEASPAQVAQINAQLRAADFTLPMASRKEFAWLGDSLTSGNAGAGLGGWRKKVVQWVVDLGLSVRFVGFRQFGLMPNRDEFAQGGNWLSTIAGDFASNLTGLSPDLVWFLGGTNNQTLQTTAQALTDSPNGYDAAFAAIEAAAVAANPSARIIVSEIPPFDAATAPTAAANEPNFNAALPARWDTYDAAHPTRALIRADLKAYLGGAYNAAYYADNTHTNDAGDELIFDGLMLAIGPAIRALSPTIKPLTCTIKAPAAASSLPYGTPVNISIRVSRYPSTVVIKKGATVLGSATMTKRDGTYSWTPLVGDVGAQTINATITDTIDSTTANATGVAVTVVSTADPATIFGTDLLQWCRADQGITVATGVSAWNDLSGLGNHYAQGTGGAQPAYNAADATLSNLPTITFDGINDFLSATSLNLAAPGTTPTYIWIVLKQISWTASRRILDSNNGDTHLIYQTGSSPAFEQYNGGSRNNNTGLAVGTWGAIGAGFANAVTDFTQVNDAAKLTSFSAGNSASTGRRIGIAFNGTLPGSIAVAEIAYAKRMPTAGDLAALSAYRIARYGF